MNRSPCIGFTLIELLVVIAITAILAGILLPVVNEARLKSLGVHSRNNLKTVYTFHVLYSADNDGLIMPGDKAPRTTALYGWQVAWHHILRLEGYIEDSWNEPLVLAEYSRFYGNIPNRQKSNMARNCWVGEGSLGEERFSQLESPSRTMLLSEGYRMSETSFSVRIYNRVDQALDPTYLGGKTYVGFTDGHAEVKWQSEVPTLSWLDDSARLFWRGRSAW